MRPILLVLMGTQRYQVYGVDRLRCCGRDVIVIDQVGTISIRRQTVETLRWCTDSEWNLLSCANKNQCDMMCSNSILRYHEHEKNSHE